MAGDVSYFWSCVFSLFCLRSRSIYTNIIGNHTTTLCTTPTKCTSQLLESQDFRCVLLLFWQHTTEQKNHQNQKFKDTQRLIRLHAQRLLISHLWVNTTSDSIAYYFVVFLAFYHFVLIAFIRFPFSLMVIVCFPKCSRTGDTHTHTLECLVRCSKGWRTEMTKARRACLIIYTGPIYWSTASLNAESSSHKWDWRTEPNRRLFFTFCIPWTQFVFFVSFADDSSVSCDSLVLRHTHRNVRRKRDTISFLFIAYVFT